MLAIYFRNLSTSILGMATLLSLASCSTTKAVLAIDNGPDPADSKPIENPFGNFGNAQKNDERSYTLKTTRGDRSVELDVPTDDSTTDMVIPTNPNLKEDSTTVAAGDLDYRYESAKPSTADREIASTFPNGNPQEELRRRDVERGLGLQPSDDLPNMDESYLAKVDVVKQLFKAGRYEASLLELDKLIRAYPTNPRIYEMRGTVLDRMGYTDLALRSWKQALEFTPSDVALKRLIERKQSARNVASEGK